MNVGAADGGNRFERACGALARWSLVVMMLLIGAEVLMRNAFGYSWEGTDEVGSYLVVAVTFLSLATCQAHGGYHELLLVKDRLGPRARAWLEATMQAICLACALVLTFYLARLAYTSWMRDDLSMTALRVPLWIPQLTMPLGTAALSVTLLGTMRRTLRAARSHDTPSGERKSAPSAAR